MQSQVDDTHVWVVNREPAGTVHPQGEGSDDYVTRITKSDTSEKTDVAVEDYPVDVAVDNNYIWWTNLVSNTVTRYTKSTGEETTISVGDATGGISLDNTYVWVVNSNNGTVTRITKADSATTTISVGGYPASKGDATGYNYARFF